MALLFATSGHSGVDRVVANLLEAFAHVPRRFDLLTLRDHGPYLGDLPDNVRSVPLPARHRNTVVPSLVRYLRRHRPEALLTASHRLNRAAVLARRLARVPTRVVLRMGMTLSGQEASLGPRRARRLYRSMAYWYPQADAVVAPSPGVGEDLERLAGVDPARLRVIPNPLIGGSFQRRAAAPLPGNGTADEWFADAHPNQPTVILGAGSLEPRKDFATLIRGFARLHARRPETRLVILGEGDERPRLEELAQELGVADAVRLPGHTANPYPYMARAGVFALTSKREGSGAVLVEALACGTPVVATDCPTGPATTLRGGEAGGLVPVGDAEALAVALERALDDPPPEATRRAATEPFRVAHAARAYLDALGVPAEGLPE